MQVCSPFEECRINADKYVIYILSCFTVQSYCCVLIIKPPAQSNKQDRVCRLVCDNNCVFLLLIFLRLIIPLLLCYRPLPPFPSLLPCLYRCIHYCERILIHKEKRIQLLQYREELFYIDNKMVLILSTIYTFSINPSD